MALPKRISQFATELTEPKKNMLFQVEDQDDSRDKKIEEGNYRAYIQKNTGYTNDIDNSRLNIWQEATSFVGVADGDYTADRLEYIKSSAAINDVTRNTSAPTITGLNYSLRMDTTTIDAAIGAGDYVAIQQKIEGYNFAKYHENSGKYGTLSFWVKVSKIGTYCISFRNSNSDRSYIVEYTVNDLNAWRLQTIVVNFDELAGTWDYGSGIGLHITWTIAAGSTFQSTADSWLTGNFLATSNQVNGVDNVANDFSITGLTFNLGEKPFAFQDYNYQTDLARCKRYYIRISNGGTLPIGFLNGRTTALTDHRGMIPVPVEMRQVPSVTFSNLNAVGNATFIAITAITVSVKTAHALLLSIDTASNLATNIPYTIMSGAGFFVADAEL